MSKLLVFFPSFKTRRPIHTFALSTPPSPPQIFSTTFFNSFLQKEIEKAKLYYICSSSSFPLKINLPFPDCSFNPNETISRNSSNVIKLSDQSMAALSLSPSCHHKHKPILANTTTSSPRMITIVSCQNRRPNDLFDAKTEKETKEDKGMMLQKFVFGVEKLGKGLQENLSPKQKGDWKDLTLMSLSFAVYVYMSQKIVCAYCAWMSMAGQPW